MKSARVKIIAALISFPMRCHSVGGGTVNGMLSETQSATRRISADHMML